MKINKTTIMITILHPADEKLPYDLSAVLEEMDNGWAVGQETSRDVQSVPDEHVRRELNALGNDGEFFDYLLTEEE